MIAFFDGAQNVESPTLKPNVLSHFRWTFDECVAPIQSHMKGPRSLTVDYKCQIYSWMKGRIEVVDPNPLILA